MIFVLCIFMYTSLYDHPLSPENTEIDFVQDQDEDNQDDFESDNTDEKVDDDFLLDELAQ